MRNGSRNRERRDGCKIRWGSRMWSVRWRHPLSESRRERSVFVLTPQRLGSAVGMVAELLLLLLRRDSSQIVQIGRFCWHKQHSLSTVGLDWDHMYKFHVFIYDTCSISTSALGLHSPWFPKDALVDHPSPDSDVLASVPSFHLNSVSQIQFQYYSSSDDRDSQSHHPPPKPGSFRLGNSLVKTFKPQPLQEFRRWLFEIQQYILSYR